MKMRLKKTGVFYKMFYKSHVDAIKMKIPKMTKQHFQQATCQDTYLIYVWLENAGQIKCIFDKFCKNFRRSPFYGEWAKKL